MYPMRYQVCGPLFLSLRLPATRFQHSTSNRGVPLPSGFLAEGLNKAGSPSGYPYTYVGGSPGHNSCPSVRRRTNGRGERALSAQHDVIQPRKGRRTDEPEGRGVA